MVSAFFLLYMPVWLDNTRGLAFLFTLRFVMTKKMDFSWLLHTQYVNQHNAACELCRDLGTRVVLWCAPLTSNRCLEPVLHLYDWEEHLMLVATCAGHQHISAGFRLLFLEGEERPLGDLYLHLWTRLILGNDGEGVCLHLQMVLLSPFNTNCPLILGWFLYRLFFESCVSEPLFPTWEIVFWIFVGFFLPVHPNSWVISVT